MCGKYRVATEDENVETRAMIAELQRRYTGLMLPRGDVRPSQSAGVYIGNERGEMQPELMQWGFRKSGASGLLINARAESAQEKITFSQAMKTHRCIIPAGAFYEWNAEHKPFLICEKTRTVLYMAGLWREQDAQKQFVVLTRDAVEPLSLLHPRMPCLLETEEVRRLWLQSEALAGEILRLPVTEELSVRCCA